MANRHPTERRHGEEYRQALTRARRMIDALRSQLQRERKLTRRLRASRDLWQRRAILSGGIRL